MVTTSYSLPGVHGDLPHRLRLAVQNQIAQHRAGVINQIQKHRPAFVKEALERDRIAVFVDELQIQIDGAAQVLVHADAFQNSRRDAGRKLAVVLTCGSSGRMLSNPAKAC